MPHHDFSNYYGPPVDTSLPPTDYSEPFSPPFTNHSPSPPVPILQPEIFAPPPAAPSDDNAPMRRSKSQDGFRVSPGFKFSSKETSPARRLANPFKRPEMQERLSPPTSFQLPNRSGAATHPPTESVANKHTPDLAIRTGTHGLSKSRSAVWSRFEEQLHASPASQEEDPQSLIMIGIDFGTTYSGVAWACSDQPDDVKTVTNWQCHAYMNEDKEKAPTEIAYASEDGNATWGYGIPDTEAVKWFKLLLLDDDDMTPEQCRSPQIRRARELLHKADKTPVQAIADYLRFLFNHTLECMKQDLGESAVTGYAFRIVLTVPAVWPTKALKRMRQAALDGGLLKSRLAGETTLHFVSEPEAAALATFADMKARPNFRTSDTFVVCDCGGGTVDLISYKVHQTSPMQLRECVKGSGSLCGAVFLDQDFEALMDQFLGDYVKPGDPAMKQIMNVNWENGIKRGFDGSERDWKVTLPYECTSQGAPPNLTLQRGHVADIFENVTSRIRALVNNQIRAVQEKEGVLPTAVVLVGGFGSCRYLFNILELENKGRGITIHRSTGAKPWTAICRGAVLKALTNSNMPGVTVESRVSRHSYGILCAPRYDKQAHRLEDRYLDPVDAKYRARNQMEWYLKKGDDIEEKKPVLLKWQKFLPISAFKPGTPLELETVIHSCENDVPPTRHAPGIKKTAVIPIKLLASQLPNFKGEDGNEYKRMSYAIEMTVIGTALEFSLVLDGKRMGAQNVEVEFNEDKKSTTESEREKRMSAFNAKRQAIDLSLKTRNFAAKGKRESYPPGQV